MTGSPSAVLFACTHNAVRSPMAEGLLKHLLGHRIYVDSAGVREGELDPFAIQVMDEIGIDIARHRPKTFDDLEDSYFDLVVSLSPQAQHRAIEMTRTMACELAFWNTLDPSMILGVLLAHDILNIEEMEKIEVSDRLEPKPMPNCTR